MASSMKIGGEASLTSPSTPMSDASQEGHAGKNGTPEAPLEKPVVQPGPADLDGTLVAWTQCGGCFVAWFVAMGLLNAYGSWQDFYVASLLSDKSASQISWIGSIQGFLLFTFSLVTGPLFDRGMSRVLISVGALVTVFGLFMTSLCTEYWQLMLAQGVVVGIGTNCLYLPSVAILPTYFTRHRALALGIAVSGSSIGGIIYSITFRRLEPRIGFGWATRVVAFISLGLLIIPVVCLKQRAKPKAVRKMFDLEAWKSPAYVVLCLGQFLGRVSIYVPYFYIPIFAAAKGVAQGQLQGYLVSLINAGSLVGMIGVGALGDKIGALNMLIVTVVLTAVVTFAWIAVDTTAGVVIFSIVYGLVSGGYMSLGPTVVINICPDLEKLGVYIFMISLTMACGILVGPPISGALLDSDGFVALQSFCGALLFGSALLAVAAKYTHTGNLSSKV